MARALTTSFLILVVSACQSPFLVFPGKTLKGSVETTSSFAFAKAYKLLQLEVRRETEAEPPYSVFLRVTVLNDHLYIDAAKPRRWHRYIQLDNRIRIKLGASIYEATAVVVHDAQILKHFLGGRTVYEILVI